MRARVTDFAPRRQDANTIKNEATPDMASPIPGTQPIKASSPNRTCVPGIRNKSSRRAAMWSRCSSDVSGRTGPVPFLLYTGPHQPNRGVAVFALMDSARFHADSSCNRSRSTAQSDLPTVVTGIAAARRVRKCWYATRFLAFRPAFHGSWSQFTLLNTPAKYRRQWRQL